MRNFFSEENQIIATSDKVKVTWSLDYKIHVPQNNIKNCEGSEPMAIEIDYPRCIGIQDKIRLFL